jgi:hypothetical protein
MITVFVFDIEALFRSNFSFFASFNGLIGGISDSELSVSNFSLQ